MLEPGVRGAAEVTVVPENTAALWSMQSPQSPRRIELRIRQSVFPWIKIPLNLPITVEFST